MKTSFRLLLLIAALALSACGNKGPLVLPDKTASPAADAQSAAPTASPSTDTAASSASPAG
ncbi:MAG: lipoprotein [Proteobacteria bacterium]|nr:lipoprotein [Pseudomonadota bacterium]